MLRKALLKAFFFLFFFALAALPTMASPSWGGGYSGSIPADESHPLSNGMEWFVRRVPVVLYDPASFGAGPDGKTPALKDAKLVWGELWTKPGWAQERTRYGLNELYIPVNTGMEPAPAQKMEKVLIPYDSTDDRDVLGDLGQALSDLFQRALQVRVTEPGGRVWAGDASDAYYIYVPVPSREAFLSQPEGMNGEMLKKWGLYLKSKDPQFRDTDGFIPSADGSSRLYLRALDAFQNGGLYYYHLILNAGPQEYNWAQAADEPPYYDEKSPDGKGFYRGKDWSDRLEQSPGAVPGFVGAVDWWANLKLSGPVEVVGAPGEEKEAVFTLANESGFAPSAVVGVKREGEQKYSIALTGVTAPAWGNGTFSLKFKVEDRPYKVRVAVLDPNMLEARYRDNFVDVSVKPLAPDLYVKLLDPGTSEAEPGKKYTGTVVFGLAADYPVPVKAALSVTNNGWAAPQADGSKYFDETWLEEFNPGEEKTFNFTWTGDGGGNTLVAKIHPATPPDDRDWGNNSKEVYVPPAGCDLAVTAWPFRDPITIGWNSGIGEGGVNIKVVRKDGYPNPVTARVTVDGPGGTQVYTITIPAGGQRYAGPYRFQVYDPGTYTVHIEAWPEGLQDAYPPDNVADVVIHAIKKEPPYTGEKEPGLHVELGGM
ncbi:MAG: hypothetical protein ACPLSY_03385 [Moorellaceae bacterium]